MKLRQPFAVELLDAKRHDRNAFSCGSEPLDRYLRQQASQDISKQTPIVYVFTPDGAQVAGYYTLSQFGIDLASLPEDLAKRLPRYPLVPATMLGRLAVDLSFRGKAIGETLLLDALLRALELSQRIASTGVVVDAKDEIAAAFYERYGFTRFRDFETRLFLPMKAIQESYS